MLHKLLEATAYILKLSERVRSFQLHKLLEATAYILLAIAVLLKAK